jgi:hypothetical protein
LKIQATKEALAHGVVIGKGRRERRGESTLIPVWQGLRRYSEIQATKEALAHGVVIGKGVVISKS